MGQRGAFVGDVGVLVGRRIGVVGPRYGGRCDGEGTRTNESVGNGDRRTAALSEMRGRAAATVQIDS